MKTVGQPDLTVAICAYNAEKRIGMVLESLAKQSVPEGMTWELLVIDNSSTDRTSAVTAEMGARLKLPLRLITEPVMGLAHARRRASIEAQAPVLSFLDDDVVAAEDWVEQCVQFMERHPNTGIVGALVEPLFERPESRPANFDEKFAGILSMYDQGRDEKRLNVQHDATPVGAGMTGRTELFRLIFDRIGSVTIGRSGTSLAGGEDLEAIFLIARMGWEIWYAPQMHLLHFVPERKLTDAYWDKWCIDTAPCNAWLTVFSGREPLMPISRHWRTWLGWRLGATKYRLLQLLPKSLSPRLALCDFRRKLYLSRASGYMDLIKRREVARQALERADLSRQERTRRSEVAKCL